MKKYIFGMLVVGLSLNSVTTFAQVTTVENKKTIEKPYNPNDNAQEKIDALLKKAKKEKKRVILQAGGNWCSWCLLFNDFIKINEKVNKELKNNFLYYHLNYSKENKNEAVFKKYAPNGDKLGYPFFIILDSNGKVVKVQESGSLEQGKGYNEEKVLSFLKSVKK